MLEKGTLVDGKYKILSEIGRGGMSVVYLAINEKANKTWAVKEVRRDGKNDYNMVRQGLITEIETLKAVKHSKLPSIIDVIEDTDSFIIVMDYIEGRSLDKIMEESGAQPEEYVKEWAKQLCDVLGYLHSQKPPIIYRDMKPSNIMLRPNGEVTIIDFGTAKKYEIETGVTTGLGTAGFAAPEQYVNSGYGRTDERTDIYALGMTLYSLLTNIDPQKTLVSDTSIRSVNPAFSRGLDHIIRKCTHRDPQERYQTCAELMYDLENIESLDGKYKSTSRIKLGIFTAAALLSVTFTVSGALVSRQAKSKATDVYVDLIEQAEQSSDEDTKKQCYFDALTVPDKAGQREAYEGLINLYGYDSVFTIDEADELEKVLVANRRELEENPEAYIDICYDVGKLFWYEYDSTDRVIRARSALKWFAIVCEQAPADYQERGLAEVYYTIGMFYKDIANKVARAEDKGMYLELYAKLRRLMDDVATDESENELVRLELLDMTRSAIQQYATKFKVDGISEEELTDLYSTICTVLEDINVSEEDQSSLLTIKKNKILDQLEDTRDAINVAYGTKKAVNGK